ncbi:unnamed protein product [Effrenium voratum]|uniref:C2H2-type domain-containing protein n=1 Tax=Effrenium voratum TaxID=2562239 RepID=A0AA36NK33_9DINO|nr:unnamed protein product [Effrenium voratum]
MGSMEGADGAPSKLVTEDLDLAGFAEGQRCFESDEESAVAFHLLLGAGSRRAIGLALAPTSLAMAVEESACVFQTHASGWLPAVVRDLLTRNLPKAYAGDPKELQEVMRSRFNVEVASIVDIRTYDKQATHSANDRCEDEARSASREIETTAKSAYLSLKVLQAHQVARAPGEAKLKNWAEQRIRSCPEGFHCTVCKVGPASEANMQQHVESAQHRKRLVLGGIVKDDHILPPVPKEYQARGIIIKRCEDTLQYMCKLCNAGPFPKLDSVEGHLRGAKHSQKEGREPELQLTAELRKEGFIQQADQLLCQRCGAGPFSDRQGLRLHRQTLQHREGETQVEMEEQLKHLPGYCHLIGQHFCCYMCNISAGSLDGIVQHLVGKGHRKACKCFSEPEPVIFCKDLIVGEATRCYPLQGRLRDGDLEPIWRRKEEHWVQAGPGAKPEGK